MADQAPSWVKSSDSATPSWVKTSPPPSESGDAPKPQKTYDYSNPWANMAGDPNLSLSDIGQVAKGAVAGIPGTPGDIEALARWGINKLGGRVSPETALPTSEDIANKFFGKPKDERDAGYRDLGSIVSPGLYGTPFKAATAITLGLRLGLRGAKSAERIGELSKAVESGQLSRDVLTPAQGAAAAEESGQSIEQAGKRYALEQERAGASGETARALQTEKQAFLKNQKEKRVQGQEASAIDREIANRESAGRLDASARGEAIQNDIKAATDKLANERKRAADKAYEAADKSMADKIANADYWQTSPSGERFLNELRNAMSTEGMTTETAATRSDMAKILADLEGVESETDIAFSDPKVLRETLRRLRDRASGHPATGFDAIDQQRAGTLAQKLANSLEEWDSGLTKADAQYRQQSEKLRPTMTRRGRAALKREKFDYNQLAADPQSMPGLFFKSEQGIDQLTELLGGDTAKVEKYAFDHALDELRGKTPDQAASWLTGQRAWLNRATLPQTYARVSALIAKARTAAQKAGTAASQATKAAKRGIALRKALRTDMTPIEDMASHHGPAAQAFNAARGRVENLERNFINKGIKPEELAGKVREMLNSPSVSSVVDRSTAQRINAEINEIERLQSKEAKIKHITEVLLKWGVIYPAIGYEATRLTGAFH